MSPSLALTQSLVARCRCCRRLAPCGLLPPRACCIKLLPLPPSCAGSPLQPFWLNESDSLLFYSLTKSACILGLARGEGFLISRRAARDRPAPSCSRLGCYRQAATAAPAVRPAQRAHCHICMLAGLEVCVRAGRCTRPPPPRSPATQPCPTPGAGCPASTLPSSNGVRPPLSKSGWAA